MTNEDKQLLLKDLCARLLYKVQLLYIKPFGCMLSEEECELTPEILQEFMNNEDAVVYPYLRPMSLMTKEEKEEYNLFSLGEDWISNSFCSVPAFNVLDWLNAHHFDYRGLIEKGIALEAPENMYKID